MKSPGPREVIEERVLNALMAVAAAAVAWAVLTWF